MKLRKGRHCVYKCEYHIVIVTKYRKRVLNKSSFIYFKEIVDTKIKDQIPDIEVITMTHDFDHIHVQISIPPKIRVSDFIRILKSITGRLLKQRFEHVRKAYYRIDGMWSDGYFVSTVGIDEEIIRRYIENQYTEDIGRT